MASSPKVTARRNRKRVAPVCKATARRKLRAAWKNTVMCPVILGGTALMAAVSALAQDRGSEIEEIVVTAQKRTESLQEVPVSITVLTGKDIETYRFRDPEELAEFVPNMGNFPVTGAGTPVFSLRGVSMRDYSYNQASTIATYVDEVYKGNPSLLAVPLFDVERVEVLRGPQGTLYGKNTTGGAVNFITRRPGTENANYVSVGTGNYGLIEAETAVDIALSDRLAARLAGTYAKADGWLKNVNPGVDDSHSIDQYGVRLSVLWQAGDDVELMLRAATAKSDPVTQGVKNVNEYPPTWFGIYGLYKQFGGTTLDNPTQEGLGHYEIANEDDYKQLVETDSVSLTLSWDVTEVFTLTSITSWDEGAALNSFEGDGVIHEAGNSFFEVEAEQFTQDLRLTSNLEGAFNFVTGLYYANEELLSSSTISNFVDIDYNLDGSVDFNDCLDPMAVAFGFPPSPAGAAVEALFNSFGFSLAGFATLGCNWENRFDQEKASIAAYFDGTYALTEALTLRFGVRYTDDESDQRNFNAHLAGPDHVPVLGTINGGSLDPLAFGPDQGFSDSEMSGKIGLDFTLDNGTLLYGLYSRGYRGGAFNAQAFLSPIERNFVGPETLDSIEIGVKSSLWDDRVRLNAAAFRYDYKGQQIIDVDNRTFIASLTGLEDSEVTGFEVEAAIAFTPALRVNLGVGYLDAHINEGTVRGNDVSGLVLPFSPKWHLIAGLDWDVFSSGFGLWTLHIDGNHRGGEISAVRTTAVKSDAQTRFNARLSLTGSDERWSASVWCKNLTDRKHTSMILSWAGTDPSMLRPPRTYGAEVTFRF